MDQHNLAILYYLKALSSQEDYIIALQNLAKVYEKKKNYDLASSTFKKILKYDEFNILANEYLDKRNINLIRIPKHTFYSIRIRNKT